MNHNTFYDSASISQLIARNRTLQLQQQEHVQFITSLQQENEHLKSSIRLHKIRVRPNLTASRAPLGTRSYDDQDLLIRRLESQVLVLTDTLSTYKERAENLLQKEQTKQNMDRNARLAVAGPVDLTVAWRPKKNELNERTILLAKRAARRKKRVQEENQQIENEQRDVVLEQYDSKIKLSATRKRNSKSKYKSRRDKRIADLMLAEMQEQERMEMEAQREEKESAT